MLKRLPSNPTDHLCEIEKLVQERVILWRNGKIKPDEQIISLFGYPGIGKTWILNYMAKNYDAVIIDLGERLKYTPSHYVSMTLAQLRPDLPKSQRFLLLDNVPATQDDEQILAFEQEVLIPYWKDGALVCQCQIRRETLWGYRVPHVIPVLIPALTAKGLESLCAMLGCEQKRLDGIDGMLFSTSEYLPLLVKRWYESSVEKQNLETTLYNFLLEWWQAVSPDDLPSFPLDHIRLFSFHACSNKQDYNTMSKMIEKAGLSNSYNPPNLDAKLRSLFWFSSSLVWYEPIRNALQTWLFLREPEKYHAIKNGG